MNPCRAAGAGDLLVAGIRPGTRRRTTAAICQLRAIIATSVNERLTTSLTALLIVSVSRFSTVWTS